MKTYFKILFITVSIQILGFLMMKLIDNISIAGGKESTVFPFWFLAISIFISTVLWIILPILWCKTKKGKIAAIIFLPTNYTWLVIILAVIKLVGVIFNSLDGIPDNFG